MTHVFSYFVFEPYWRDAYLTSYSVILGGACCVGANTAKSMSHLVLEQYGEGQTKGDEEDGEDAQRLEQCGQDLQEHHHVNPKHVKPGANRSQ